MAGTPVSMDSFSVASPAVSEYSSGRKRTSSEQGRELQAKMQDMISMQYQAQEIFSSSSSGAAAAADGMDGDGNGDGNDVGDGIDGGDDKNKATSASRMRSSRSQSSGLVENDEIINAPHPSIRGGLSKESPASLTNDVVGKGTIFFSTKLKNAMGLSSPTTASKPSPGGGGAAASSSSSLQQPPISTASFSSPPRPPPPPMSSSTGLPPAGSLSVSPDHPSLAPQQQHQQHQMGTPSIANNSKKNTGPQMILKAIDDETTVTTTAAAAAAGGGGNLGGLGGLSLSSPRQKLSLSESKTLQTPMTVPGQSTQQQIYAGYGSVQDRNKHTFHYGKAVGGGDGNLNTASSDGPGANFEDEAGGDDDELKGLLLHDLHHRSSDVSNTNPNLSSSRCRKCCSLCHRICCLWAPFVNCIGQENLNRSFCFGAVDGLLTGSGLVAALMGLGVLHSGTLERTRLAVVALVTSACLADALAMAIGHIWNTYFVVSNHAEERTQERLLLESNKAEAKSKLVDLLLSRAGMLKIDAMSLADALEGYPDLFVSALIGDSLISAADEVHGGLDAFDDEETQDGGGSGMGNQNAYNSPKAGMDSAERRDGEMNSFGSWRFPSYGRLRDDIMHFDTPEASNVNVVFRESQKEGCFMMMGFALFAVLPSLLWLVMPMCFTEPTVANDVIPHSSQSHGNSISVSSLIMFILSLIVWSLGVWKSRFVESSWAVFGIESVAVLFVCVLSAYGTAAFFVYCMAGGGKDDTSSDDDDSLTRSLLGLSDL